MATREENLKKINDELEKMSDEELDQVAGGTNGEYKELRRLLPGISQTSLRYREELETYEETWVRYMKPHEVAGWLKQNLNIDAIVDDGAWYNPLDSAGNSNVYRRNGQSLTHAQVIAEVRNFLGK